MNFRFSWAKFLSLLGRIAFLILFTSTIAFTMATFAFVWFWYSFQIANFFLPNLFTSAQELVFTTVMVLGSGIISGFFGFIMGIQIVTRS